MGLRQHKVNYLGISVSNNGNLFIRKIEAKERFRMIIFTFKIVINEN